MSSAGSGPDPEILELFRAELDTHLPTLSQGLLAMEKGQVDAALIEAMMRAAHSIKGAARIVGIAPVVSVAHALEDCFSAAKSKKITLNSQDVDDLLAGVDALQQLCGPGAGEAVAIEPLIARLSSVRDGKRPAAQPAQPAPQIAAPPAPVFAAQDEPVVTFPPVLDEAAAVELRGKCLELLDRATTPLVLDLALVTDVSAAGMAFLVSLAREAAAAKPAVNVRLRAAHSDFLPLWRVLGISDLAVEQ